MLIPNLKMAIKDTLLKIKSSLPSHVTLVAVSKTKPVADLMEAYDAGQRIFGENKIQEMTEKWEQMPKDIQWHMIGHVQTNKVKYLAPFVHTIQSIDSLKLLLEIDKQAAKHQRVINGLLQFHIAREETKFGLSQSEAKELLHSEELAELNNIRLIGLMGMATNTNGLGQIRQEFQGLKHLYDELGSLVQRANVAFCELSMGMSGDYAIAIEEGSTLIRVGSAIFGERN